MDYFVFSFHLTFPTLDYSAVGGCLLLLDLCLFTMVVSFWDATSESGQRIRTPRQAPPKR